MNTSVADLNMKDGAKKTNNGNYRIEYMRISTKDMFPHPIAQREFIPEHAHKIAKDFSWDRYSPVDVSFRDGRYWVIDGQHRIAAIRERFGGDCVILARVRRGMTIVDEAMFFVNQDKGRKTIKYNDKISVKYRIGDEDVVDAVRCAALAGWRMDEFSKTYSKGRLTAHATIMKLYKRIDREQFIDLLKVLYEAWDGDPRGACREILNGMERFYKMYWGEFDGKILAKKLSKLSPEAIVRDGRSANIRSNENGLPFARAILRQYNYGARKNVLPDRF